jgi:hypothetical protein
MINLPPVSGSEIIFQSLGQSLSQGSFVRGHKGVVPFLAYVKDLLNQVIKEDNFESISQKSNLFSNKPV